MWARFTVLNETPIASAIAGCVIPLSRSNTIWMRSRCAAGIFHRRAVFSCRICFLVHLTIRPPESDGQSESYYQLECEPEKYRKPAIQTAMEAVLQGLLVQAFPSLLAGPRHPARVFRPPGGLYFQHPASLGRASFPRYFAR